MQLSLLPKTVYLLSGGKSSTLAAYYHRAKHPERDYIYYFNDTLVEHKSTYRFLIESLYFLSELPISSRVAKLVKGIPDLSWQHDPTLQKRTRHLDRLFEVVCNDTGLHRERFVDPWASFSKHGYIGNTRVDICSWMLKREPRRAFTDRLLGEIEICLGFNWTEIARLDKAIANESNLIAPLATDFVNTFDLWDEFHAASGIQEGEAYGLGLAHDNCSGACVKSGQAQWKLVWEKRPEVYEWCENRMEEIMGENPNLKPFLRKTIGGELKYLSLKEYRVLILEPQLEVDLQDFGGCGCAV